MEWRTRRRRGGGGGEEGVGGGAVLELAPWLLLLLALAASVPGARGLDMDTGPGSDAALLLSFKRAVTADPLGVLSAWSLSPSGSGSGKYSPCAWNGVICNGFPASPNATSPPPPVNATSNSNSTAAGIDAASLVAAATTVSRVTGLVLPNAQLSGTIPAELALIPHLRHLDLSNNALNGTLPPALLLNASDLRILSLAGNDLSGSLPVPSSPSYPNGSLLQELNISDNALSGPLPEGLLHLPSLAVLALANNYLAGGLPGGGVWDALEVLDLSDNYFEGALPSDFGGVKLRTMNVSSNRLTGDLPVGLAAVLPANATVDLSGNNFTGAVPAAGVFGAQPAAAYEGNPRLCGPPLDRSCSIPSSLSRPPNGTSDSPPAFAAIPKGSGRGAAPGGAAEEGQGPGGGGQGKLRPAAIVAIVAGDLAGVGVLFALFLYVYHVRKRRREHGVVTPPEPQQKSARGAGGVKTVDVDIAGVREDRASTSTGCCIGRGKSDGSESSDCSASSSDAGSDGDEDIKRRHPGSFIGWSTPQHHSKKHHEQQQAPAPATLVTVDDGGGGELEMETLLKASAYILGATGSSIVYKAVLADGTALAVRRIGESGGADRLKDFEAQVRGVTRFRHPNVLRLRGFYWGADEKLLIHDYAANGSLANIAFTRRFGASSSPMHLSLEARLRIARGVARGLAYIHEKKGVHGNVKPSNILLSVDMEPWIGDLGLDRLVSGEGMYRSGVGASARLFGSKRSMHSTSSLPDLSQMPGGAGASPCTSSSSTAPPPYQAPECLKNLRPNAKWDVYSFGMVLLELLSGRVYSEVELCQWHAGSVASATADEQRVRVLRIADPTLRGEADGNEDTLLGCFRLAFACCAMAPGKRPSMRDAAVLLDRMPAASTSTAETPY